jgi:hypothetical protein
MLFANASALAFTWQILSAAILMNGALAPTHL